MSIVDRTIDVFERRLSELEKIREISNLPRWTDADVIGASCLIEQYRNLTSRPSRAAECCPHCHWFPKDKGKTCRMDMW